MSLWSLVVGLIIIGVLLWLVNVYIPMDATIKKIINVVVIVAVIIWLLSVFGILGDAKSVKVPQVNSSPIPSESLLA
jgi:hypothetical protein